jgi:hypothetical protein
MTDKAKSAKKQPKGDYTIGFSKPPKSARWQPGQSGNPSGRPKKRPTYDELFMKEAEKIVTAKYGDKIVKCSKIEAIIQQALNVAAKTGRADAVKYVSQEYRKAHAMLEKQEAKEPEDTFSWDEEHAKLLEDIKKICEEVDSTLPPSEKEE